MYRHVEIVNVKLKTIFQSQEDGLDELKNELPLNLAITDD